MSNRERGLCDGRGFTQTQVSVGGVGAARNWGDNCEVLGTSHERLTDLETTGKWQAHIFFLSFFLIKKISFRGWLASVVSENKLVRLFCLFRVPAAFSPLGSLGGGGW